MREYLIWLAKLLTVAILFMFVPVLLLIVVINAADGRSSREALQSDKLVAVVELNGMILDSKEVITQLTRQAQNSRVKGIVLRIDSPGGSVGPSQEIFTTVRKLRALKPIVVSMGGVAASGGLYASLSASKVFSQPGTLTGSIGVIMQIPNVTELSKKLGFNMITIKSGQFKDVGNMFRTMSDEDKQYLEKMVTAVRNEFVGAIVDGRGLDRAKVEAFADGRILTGSQALEVGLVDKLGDIYDAAREVFEILKTPLPASELPQLYYPEDKFAKFRKFFDGATDLAKRLRGGSLVGREVQLMYVM